MESLEASSLDLRVIKNKQNREIVFSTRKSFSSVINVKVSFEEAQGGKI